MRRRILTARVLVPCAILLLIVGLGIVVWLLLRDEPPPSEEGLREVRREIPDADNGFLLLDLQEADTEWPEEDEAIEASSEDFDPEAARKVVEANAGVLETLDAALARPDFQTPEVRSLSDPCRFLVPWRTLAYVLAVRCRLHREAGREAEAFEDALRLVRFGERVENAQGPVIYYLVGLALRNLGVEELDRCLRATSLPADLVVRYLEELARHPPRPGGLQAAYRIEHAVFAKVLDGIAEGDVEALGGEGPRLPQMSTIVFKRNQTKRILGEYLRCAIDLAGRQVLLAEDIDDSVLCGGVDPTAVPFTNYLGGVVLGFLLPTLERVTEERAKAVLRARALDVLYAVRRFETDRGRLPDRLDDLVPAYLDSVPVDPFGGVPLRYSPEKRILYSIGRDLEDSGGSEAEGPDLARDDRNEPTFRLIGDAPPAGAEG